MPPHPLLGLINRHQLLRTQGRRIAAAKISGDETFHACSGRCVGEADLQVVVGASEGDDKGVVALEGGDELGGGEGVGEVGCADGGWVGGFGGGAGEDGDGEGGGEEGVEDGGAQGAVGADEGDFVEGHGGFGGKGERGRERGRSNAM